MKEKYTFEFLEAYLDGQLSPEEVSALEKDLQNDAELQKALEQHRETRSALKLLDQLETRNEVGKIYQNLPAQAISRRLPGARLAIAAGIIFLLTVGLLYILRPDINNLNQLADQNFDPYPDRITTMSDQTNDSLLLNAMNAYNQADFDAALESFILLPADHPQRGLIDLYIGISQLSSNSSQAILDLSRLKENNDPLSSTASWYLALAYLKKADKDSAIKELEALVAEGNYRKAQASELLEKLKK